VADSTVFIKFQIRDEVSAQLIKIANTAQQASSSFHGGRARAEMDATTKQVEHLSRSFGQKLRQEFTATLGVLGVGGLVGGGFVAGIAAAGRSFTEFANSSLKLQYTTKDLGISAGAIHT
jgi:hypothetical protein